MAFFKRKSQQQKRLGKRVGRGRSFQALEPRHLMAVDFNAVTFGGNLHEIDLTILNANRIGGVPTINNAAYQGVGGAQLRIMFEGPAGTFHPNANPLLEVYVTSQALTVFDNLPAQPDPDNATPPNPGDPPPRLMPSVVLDTETEFGLVTDNDLDGKEEVVVTVVAPIPVDQTRFVHVRVARTNSSPINGDPEFYPYRNVEIRADNSAPTAATIALDPSSDSGIKGDRRTKDTTPTFMVTLAAADVDADGSVELFRGGTRVGITPAAATMVKVTDTLGVSSDGNYEYKARVVDAAGNAGAFGAVVDITIDTTVAAPTAPRLLDLSNTGSRQDNVTKDTSPTFAIDNIEPGATVVLLRGNVEVARVDGAARSTVELRDSLAPGGTHEYSARQIDVAKNESAVSSSATIIIDATAGPATIAAPGTPVYTVEHTIPSSISGVPDFLQPWTSSFDNTTQTLWLTFEKGHRLGQWDPATGTLKLYDVRFPVGNGGSFSGMNPHGVFFDFNTHLLPRVWFTYRNFTPGRTDERYDPRLSYYDVASGELVTYDLTPLLGGDQGVHAVFVDTRGHVWLTAEHGNSVLEFDFSRRVDGRRTADGRPEYDFNRDDGVVVVHRRPDPHEATGHTDEDESGAGGGTGGGGGGGTGGGGGGGDASLLASPESAIQQDHAENEITSHSDETSSAGLTSPHGLEVVIDDQTGEAYVWITELASGRVVLLRPATAPGAEDAWAEWNVNAALAAESDSSTRTGHALFAAVNDNETPGNPADDTIVVSDPGFRKEGGMAGVIRILDPREYLVAPDQADHSLIRTWRLPAIATSDETPDYAGTNQSFVDRQGTVFYIDRVHGVGRLDPRVYSEVVSEISAPILRYTSRPQELVGVQPSERKALAATIVPLSVEKLAALPMTGGNNNDRSPYGGVDQYQVASDRAETNQGNGPFGAGPFRGSLNATNVLYGSLADSDRLTTTVFAETSRRQMSVVTNAEHVPAGVEPGRMAFQVLRDGSLVMTARADGSILDRQVNLSVLLTESSNRDAQALLIEGDASAAIDANGVVSVFGKNRHGALVIYQFNPGLDQRWSDAELRNAAHWQAFTTSAPIATMGILVGDPIAYRDGSGFVKALVTTNLGQLLQYDAVANAMPRNLTTTQPVYSTVGVVEQNGIVYAYGTNQTGSLVEYSFLAGMATTAAAGIVYTPPTGETRMLQDVTAIEFQGQRHVFAVDGNSRLVHLRITANSIQAMNVSQDIADTLSDNSPDGVDLMSNDRAFGYFNFQEPYVARVYSGLTAMTTASALYVYGTNGDDLIEFEFSQGTWQAANLTNDTLSTRHQDPDPNQGRAPANDVFGAPAGYRTGDNERHILQINADGEVVEYYYLDKIPNPRFHTQNVTLAAGNSSEVLQVSASIDVVTGADAGASPHVRVLDRALGGEKFGFLAYDAGFRGGVRVATGDVSGDGTPDIITAPGPGGGPHIRVFDGQTGQPLAGEIGGFFAYDPTFTGGVFVASGDFDGDNKADIVTSADAGGGPHIRVFSGATGQVLGEFLAYDGAFTGGVRVAVADLGGRGTDQIITAAGPGGGPHVKVFLDEHGAPGTQFMAYDPAFAGGVYVASGDLNGDDKPDIVTGAGAGGGPHVRAFDGSTLAVLADFMAFKENFLGGIRVSTGDADGDGLANILAAPGPEREPLVQSFSLDGTLIAGLSAYPGFRGGVFIASSPAQQADDAMPGQPFTSTSSAEQAPTVGRGLTALASAGPVFQTESPSMDHFLAMELQPSKSTDEADFSWLTFQAEEQLNSITDELFAALSKGIA